MTVKIDDFASQTAKSGFSGYWEFPEHETRWNFEAGLPDPSTFPVDDLSRICDRVLRTDADDGLQYGSPQRGSIAYGYEGLREVLLERTEVAPGRQLDLRSAMLTLGGVQGIKLACDAFLDPGDAIAVEAPTWGAALMMAGTRGAESIPVPLDDDGLQLDVLEREVKRLAGEGRRLKLVYTIATFNTPTGISLSAERRRRLVSMAQEWNFLVLEDNVYGELRYDGEPLPTLLSLDDGGYVVKLDSFSKTLAPALRLGWVTGDPAVVAAMSAVKGDLGVSQFLARVVAEYVREGGYDAHVARVNRLYREKRDVAVAALAEHCAPWLTWNVPEGGYFLWLALGPEVDGELVMKRALAEGVVCRPGERFFGDVESGRQLLRLSFVTVPIEEIERGIGVLGRAIRESVR